MNEVGGSSLRSRANASNSAWVTLDQMGGSLKVARWLHSSRFAEMHCRLGGRWGPAHFVIHKSPEPEAPLRI